jgi:hypothetical protein
MYYKLKILKIMTKEKMKIEMTADWVLDKFSESLYADGKGNLTISNLINDLTQHFLLELTLQQLGIPFESGDYYDEENEDNTETRYDFKLTDLDKVKDYCPEFFKRMSDLNYNNSLSGIRNSKINNILKN